MLTYNNKHIYICHIDEEIYHIDECRSHFLTKIFYPKIWKVYDFGQSTTQLLFTNVKIMFRRYILSLGSKEIARCQRRLLSLDAVAPIGTAIEKDASYKVKTRVFRIYSISLVTVQFVIHMTICRYIVCIMNYECVDNCRKM